MNRPEDVIARSASSLPSEVVRARQLISQGALPEASEILRRQLEREPASAEAWTLMALIARLTQNLELAERFANTALSANSGAVESWFEKAEILLARQRTEEALPCYQHVVGLDPAHFDAHARLGECYKRMGQLRSAVGHLQSAAEARPDSPDLQIELADVCDRLGLLDQAELALTRSLTAHPEHVPSLLRLGNLYRDRHQPSRAKELYQRAHQLRPNDPYILSNLANAWMDVGDAASALGLYQKSLSIYPDQPTTHSNFVFTLHYVSGVSPHQIVTAHREWDQRHTRTIEPLGPFSGHDFSEDRPLRVGFVSGDLRNHPVGRFVEVLFRNLNPKEMAAFAYHSATREDEITARIREHAAGWRAIHDLGEKDAALKIREDQIDILCDLSGHTAGNRLRLFAYRAAPVQASTWVYPGTTGLASIDYRITDPFADPPEDRSVEYPERLARLPNVSWVYQPPPFDLDPVPAPALTGEPFTFGCLNNPNKISDAAVELWSVLLRRVPRSRLILLARDDAEHAEYLRNRFARHGVQTNRLLLRPKTSIPKYLEYHREIDLMLDPFPYNGCTTTCDSLWMGVPVLTLAGDYFVSRQGVSFVRNLALPECVANSPQDFLDRASDFAGAPERLQSLRAGLRERLKSSPLMDYAGYARDFAALLRELWQERRQVVAEAASRADN